MKAAKSQNNTKILKHWKTKEKIICVASYEVKVVQWLNKNKIEYLWQPKMFEMPNGKRYLPDVYIIGNDLWIEIKGYFRKDAKEKWEWFHNEYPNSELWNEDKLKEMEII